MRTTRLCVRKKPVDHLQRTQYGGPAGVGTSGVVLVAFFFASRRRSEVPFARDAGSIASVSSRVLLSFTENGHEQ